MTPDGPASDSEWVWLTEEPYVLTFAWSPGGDRLYYFHSRDGFRCLWSQALDLSRGRPVGPPEAIRHFHSYQDYPLNGSPIAAGSERLLITLSEHRSNIWRATLHSR